MADNHIEILGTEDDSLARVARSECHAELDHARRPIFGLKFIRRIFGSRERRSRSEMLTHNADENRGFETEDCNYTALAESNQHKRGVKKLSRKQKHRTKSHENWQINNEQSNSQHHHVLTNSNHRRISWTSFKNSFKRSRQRHKCKEMNEDESNITVDIDGQRREDSPILKRTNELVPGSAENDDINKFDSGCLKTFSERKDAYCIPRKIYKVINCPWYWGNIDRVEAAMALQTNADGYFLLRKSAHPDFLFTISFKSFKKTMHVRIESGYESIENQDPEEEMMLSPWIAPGRFFPTYPRLLELIDMCQKPIHGNFFDMPFLVTPLKRKEPLSLKEIARSELYNIYTYTAIESLHIPKELERFLKDYRFKLKNTNVLPGQKYLSTL